MTNGVRMQGWGTWSGLSRSPFLADVGPEDRDPRRIATTLALGLAVGILASIAGWIVVVAPYAVLSGDGGRGLAALGDIARLIQNTHDQTLAVVVLRLLFTVATNQLFLLVFVAVAAALAGRALKRYLTAAATFRWRLLAAGLVLGMAALIPAVIAEHTFGAVSTPVTAISNDWVGRLAYLVASVVFIPAALAEELMFRGWLMRQISASTRRPSLLLLFTGVVFAALHFDFDPTAFITRATMGAGLAYMTLRLGGVELAAGVHAANNIMIVLFIEQLGGTQAVSETGLSIDLFVSNALTMAVYVGLAEAVARIAPLSRLLGVQPRDLSPGGAATAPLN